MARYGPHRLMCLNKPMGAREWNVVVWICLAQKVALLGAMVLLEEVSCCGGGFWRMPPHPLPSFLKMPGFSWLQLDQDVELSAPFPAPCLPGCCHASHLDDNGLNFWTCKTALNLKKKYFFLKIRGGHGVSSQQWKCLLSHRGRRKRLIEIGCVALL